MKKTEFILLLAYPEAISLFQTNQLEEILEQYPFFQAAHALRLKGLKNHKSFLYDKALKKTAAHTTDRSILFEWITSGSFLQNNIAKSINDQTTGKKAQKTEENLHDALRMNPQEANQVLDPHLFQIANNPQKTKVRDFDPSEEHSFSQWLKLTAAKPISRKEKGEKSSDFQKKHRKSTLVDRFISKNPKIKPQKKSIKEPPTSGTAYFPDKLMTQTLAKVYLEQKNYAKAIRAYKILILKNPEKSGFFADQIRAIEKLQENKNQ